MNRLVRLAAMAFFLFGASLFAQPMPLETLLCSLDLPLQESSGLLRWNDSTWMTINDGGGQNRLYFFDGKTGSVVQECKLDGAQNVDWEALAMGPDGDVYVGDIGNNLNKRKNQCIYRVRSRDLMLDVAPVEVIHFSYADQKNFPPDFSGWHYDAEAMVVGKTHIYLFTKNRARPMNGYTYLYRIPNEVGTYQAERVDSIFLGTEGIREEFWVSAAYWQREKRKLYLLSYQRLFVLDDWNESPLEPSKLKQYRFGTLRQREAVVVSDDGTFLTEEGNSAHRAHFYRADIHPDTVFLMETRADSVLRLKGFTSEPVQIGYEIFDQLGRRLDYGLEKDTVHGRFFRRIDIRSLPKSEFVFFAHIGKMKRAFRFSNRRKIQSRATEIPAPPGRK